MTLPSGGGGGGEGRLSTDGRSSKSGNYLNSCNEFIHMLNTSVMRHSEAKAAGMPVNIPGVMVMTFSSPCLLSKVGWCKLKPVFKARCSA